MVSKMKSTSEKEQKKGRVKVGKLKLNRETVKDLADSEARRVKGGAAKTRECVVETVVCTPMCWLR